MTKEITKANLLQELQDKFKLREFEPETFTFGEQVSPIYDIGQHLRVQEARNKIINITSLGGFTFYTVPDNEKWFLNAYTVVFTGAGAIKIAGVYIRRRSEVDAFCYLDLTKNQIISYTHVLPYPMPLEHGDRIAVNCDDYTSSQDLHLYVDFTMETIR